MAGEQRVDAFRLASSSIWLVGKDYFQLAPLACRFILLLYVSLADWQSAMQPPPYRNAGLPPLVSLSPVARLFAKH